ncbi:MAG: DUF4340 domain-containing protein [Chloroflexi bacterium]|nr:DUF4340 domain-containing protein [Chloroflexota bacterium]
MAKHPISYFILIGFGIVLMIMLLLDNPADKQADMVIFGATQQALAERLIFPAIDQTSQVSGIEVLDVTTGKGILVMRNAAGSWYAPEISGIQVGISAESLNQMTVEQAAAAFRGFLAEQWYEATPENYQVFGLEPEPRYRIRFQMQMATSEAYEARLDVGDTNPNDMAYYVYIDAVSEEDRRIYLIDKQTVDIVLTMLSESILAEPAVEKSPTAQEAETPVP